MLWNSYTHVSSRLHGSGTVSNQQQPLMWLFKCDYGILCLTDVHPYFKTIGPRQEFLCYVINYLLCLSEHKERRLDLSREELLVVTAMAFREESHTPVRFENVRPSIRCFTVSSWFQVRELEVHRKYVDLTMFSW